MAPAETAAEPRCPLCDRGSRVLYPSTLPANAMNEIAEFACSNPHMGQHDTVWWCDPCRLGWIPLVERPEEIRKQYEETLDEEYLAEADQRIASFDQVVRRIERHHRPGKVLEIGSMVGLFLIAAQRRGWVAQGIEPSRWAVEYGTKEYGVDLVEGTIESATVAPRSVDCVVMMDVLEHLTDPLPALQRCRQWIKPDGILALSTINIDTVAHRVLRARWPWFMRMHLFYFTPRSLRIYLRRAGFDLVAIERSPRTFHLDYLGRRFAKGGVLRRSLSRVVQLPVIGRIPLRVSSRDLVLVIAKPSATRTIRS